MFKEKKHIYFASDFHFGTPTPEASLARELRVVEWMQSIRVSAAALYLVGDIFDYWYEYRSVVPKGYTHFFAELRRWRDMGIDVYFFTGNHDVWMYDYFPTEFGIPVYHEPIVREFDGRSFYIGHGDGLGDNDLGYRLLKGLFTNRLVQWCYTRLHPDLGARIATFASRSSRAATGERDAEFLGNDREHLCCYSEMLLRTTPHDFFIFGHRHLPLDITLSDGKARYINLGDWLNHNTFAVWDGSTLLLERFDA